jgi:RNA polymerase sigma factor (sigma-70 family)
MQPPFSSGSGPSPTPRSHPFAPHEKTLQALFLFPSPCSENDDAISALYETAFRIATAICQNNRDRAVDAVSEWYCQLKMTAKRLYNPHRPMFPWAYQALVYVTYRMVRASHLDTRPLTGEPASEMNSASDLAELSEVGEMVSRLPESLRITMQLRCLHGLSAKETAAILGIRANAVNLRMLRAMKLLRRAFGLS